MGDIFGAFYAGFLNLFAPATLLYLAGGVLLGNIIGIIPGLGATVGVSLLLAVMFGLDPGVGIVMLIGVHAAAMTAGSIPAILMKVPGSAAGVATMLDGYAMAEKGEGSRAVGAALTASALGGILSVPLAFGMMLLIIPLVLAMRSPEMTLLVVVGLSFLATAGGTGNIPKNLIAGALGILISTIGVQASTGLYRFTFGIHQLADGLTILIVALGIFAMSEAFDLFLSGKESIAKAGSNQKVKFSQLFQGARDVFRHRWLFLRSSITGYIIGVIPGIGGAVAPFIAYGQGQKMSKNPEQWGTGIIEGVIAPEASNDATVGGSTLTTLAFGIPGDSIMAIILGAFLIFGIVPGKELLDNHLDMVTMILLAIALGNLLGVLMLLPIIPYLNKLTHINAKYIISILLVLVFAASYSSSRNIADLFILIGLGILGVCMKRMGFSMACFILGFILGPLFERYLFLSLRVYGIGFLFSSPITYAFLVLLLVIFTHGPIKSLIRNRARRAARQ